MALTAPHLIENRWDPARVADADELGALVYRSNLLASDRSVVNFGGGNTSVKVRQPDHTGREVTVMWVKGSGSDLASIDLGGCFRPVCRRPLVFSGSTNHGQGHDDSKYLGRLDVVRCAGQLDHHDADDDDGGNHDKRSNHNP